VESQDVGQQIARDLVEEPVRHRLNSIATSVTRFASRLPERR
jgi:hypothetical protein